MRLRRLTTFAQRRVALDGHFGLHLTVGMIAMLAAGLTFVAVALAVMRGTPLTAIDADIAARLHDRSAIDATGTMLFVTAFGGGAVITAFAVIIAGYLYWQRRWYALLALVISIPGGALVNVLLKVSFQRPRPHFDDPIMVLTTYSFPSGHAMAATIAYGLMAAGIASRLSSWRWRASTVMAATALVVTIAFSRVYLGVHYFSDVVAAIAAGIVWLAFSLTVAETLRRVRLGPHDRP